MTHPVTKAPSDEEKLIERTLALSKGATGGEWGAVQNDDPRGQPVVFYRGLVCTVEHSPDRYLSVVAPDDRTVSREEWPHNASLIAEYRTLAPALATLLRERNEQLEWVDAALIDTYSNQRWAWSDATQSAIDAARARQERKEKGND